MNFRLLDHAGLMLQWQTVALAYPPMGNFQHEVWLWSSPAWMQFLHMLCCRCNFCLDLLKSGSRAYGPLVFASRQGFMEKMKGRRLWLHKLEDFFAASWTHPQWKSHGQCWVLGLINIPGPFHCFWVAIGHSWWTTKCLKVDAHLSSL